MDKQKMVELISSKIKLIRIEKGYTQDRMAEVIGISKKTLVQIEKGRSTAGWTNTIAICALFRDSDILYAALGDDPLIIIGTLAHDHIYTSKDKTLGGKVWWKLVKEQGDFRLQQNIISQHYRILDANDYRWFSSFEKEEALDQLHILADEYTGERSV